MAASSSGCCVRRFEPTTEERSFSRGKNAQRRLTGHRLVDRQCIEIAKAVQRLVEQGAIARTRHFDGAKTAQMLGDELGVEQGEAATEKACDEMHERDLRGVARAVKHALTEEGTSETDAVEASGEFVALQTSTL